MEQIAKLILITGALLIALGLGIWGLAKAGFRGLPGDIRVESENVRFYFPVVTCVVISIVLTLLLWLWQWLRRG